MKSRSSGAASFPELFYAQVERAPERIALRVGTTALSYAELDNRASRMARALRSRGVGRGQRVGLCVERGADMLAALLGILRAGAAYVPLDPAFPQERLRFMAQDAELSLLVSTSALASAFGLPPERQLLLNTGAAALAAQSDQRLTPEPALDARAEDPAYVIYTSGSTGKPKGVVVPHRAVGNFLVSMAREPGLTADDVLVAVTTLSFDIAVLELQLPLTVGAAVVIASRDQAMNGHALKGLLEQHRATVMQATPVTWRLLLEAGWQGRTGFKALVGGEALPKDLADQLIARGVELWNMYGPTETTVWSTCARITDTSNGITIGKPIANTTVYVLDERNHLCPDGVPGELCIGGDGVALGYWNRPELTAERFIPDPYSSAAGARLYRTGDLVRQGGDGLLEHLGRLDFQVKIRGFRIELGEIETNIATYPSVREAVVIAREDVPGDQRLVAYVVPRDGEISAADLKQHLSHHLPPYMVPSAFVMLDALPLTPNAKIDRRALPAPGHSDLLQKEYVAPQTATEELLAGIWGEVLGLKRVGVHDNFFELGGHSLLVVSVMERMRRVGLHADVRDLYLTPTIAAMAAVAGGEGGNVEVPPNRIPPGCAALSPDMLPLVRFGPEEIAQVVAAVPGGAANIQDIYPLAPLQEGLLFHHRMTAGGDGYLTRTLYGFDSRDRLNQYLQALQAVVDRNDILRTAVLWEGLPEPVQVVYRRAPLIVEEVTPGAAADGSVAEQLRVRFDPRSYRLDVRQAPLMRLFIAQDAANGRWLMQQMVHHLIDDQITMNFVREEIRAHLLGQAGQLPAPLPFRNFVAQSRLGVPREEHEAFFRKLLGDVDETTAPFGLTDVKGHGSGIAEARSLVDPALARRLREAGQVIGVSAGSVFHLAWAQVLARVSGREDVVFGTVLLGRMQGGEGAERVLGTCINTLPMRIRVGGTSVKEGVRHTHSLLAQLLRHEHAQLALAQRCSAVAPNTPLFSALLNYRHGEPEGQSPEGADQVIDGVDVLDFEERTNYPLTLSVDDTGEGFRLVAQAQSPVDPQRICGYMHLALEQIVVALEAAPDSPLRSLDVLPDAERQELLAEWNDTARDYGPEVRLHRLIEEQAALTPNSVALEFEGQTLSYVELNHRANQLARLLRQKGVGPEVLVGVFAERSFEMVLALLAILKSGGAYVPLDPSYPAERLAHMLEDARTHLVLAQPHLASQLPPQAKEVHLLDASWAAYAHEAVEDLEDLGTPRNLAYVIFTSGSTGRPKGAMNEHRGIRNRLLWMQEEYGLTGDDRILQKTQFSFDVSVWEFFWPLMTGARLVIARPEGHRDSAYLVKVIRESGITTLHFVPSMLRVFLEEEGLEACGSLKRVLCSGEALPHELQERFFARLPNVELHNLYGPTEAAVDVTYWACRRGDERLTVPIGRPVANTQMYVLDARMRPAPLGVAGELFIGGVQVGRGYVGRDDLTVERFVPDPFSRTPGARLYKTGDLARHLPDGAIEYLGRLDYQVKIRGQRIELGEIEATLDKHPGVGQSVVLAREDTPGDQRLVAYVVARQAAPSAEELKEHLSRELPAYMVPSAFVFLEALPLTSSGKADRKLLPAPERSGARATYVEPRTATEEILAAIWAELLKLDRVGRDDDFFELGGHSLLAVSVIERMRRVGLNADVRTLFITPTVAALAAATGGDSGLVDVPPNRIPPNCQAISPDMLPLVQLTSEEIARVVAAVPGGAANIQDIYPLAPLQEGFLFHHVMASEGDGYLLTYQFGFDSRERLDQYLQALQAVTDRNDIMRTAVLWEGLPEALQVVYRRAPLIVEEVNLDATGGDVAQQMWARFNMRTYRLDVRQAPLMRIFVAHDAAKDRWVMQQMVHHLMEDMPTMRLVQDEVHMYLRGQADQLLPPLPFRNFVAQSRLGVSAEEHERFFRKLLGDVDETTAPFGLTDVKGDGSGVVEARSLVDADLARRLRKTARALGVSAASVFHLAWALVLARVSGRENVVFGSVLLGRMQGGEGADRILGPCINTLPIRIHVGEKSAQESVRQTHTVLAQLMRHEHASLAVAQRCSAMVGNAPLFSALLNYRHSQDASQTLAVAHNSADGHNVPVWLFQDIAGREFLNFEERTNYPFEMSVDDFGEGFRLDVQVQSPLDPQRVCAYMQNALEQLVGTLETTPTAPLSNVGILPEAERRQLQVEWNATQTEYPARARMQELFEAQVDRAPERTAIRFGAISLSYAELDARANRIAQAMRLRGVCRGQRVGVCVERGADMLAAVLGILKSGAAYVPLDPVFPVERLRFMVEDAQLALLVSTSSLADSFGLPRERQLLLDGDAAVLAAQSDGRLAPDAALDARPEDPAYVIYTSGSTGKPKGVAVPHGAVVNFLASMAREPGLSADDVLVAVTTLSFDIAVLELQLPLTAGATVVIASRDEALDGFTLSALLEQHRATVMQATPVTWRLLLAANWTAKPQFKALVGGEGLPKDLADQLIARGIELWNMYGPTETTVWSTCARIMDTSNGITIGKPIANTTVYIVDAQKNLCPIGVPGELCIGGAGVSLGYWNRPELTADRFTPDPFSPTPGARLYRTGDRARWRDDGTLEHLGRLDFQVKVRGYRIELGEIETAIASHKAIREAVVVVREDVPGDPRLVAYFVAQNPPADLVDQLRAQLRAGLPEYMVPSAFVALEALPLTPNAKVDRKALPAPDGSTAQAAAYVAPRTVTEGILADIWAEVLGLDRVSIEDNFFELGGHSLLAMQVVSRLRQALSVELPLSELFAAPTVAGLAARTEAFPVQSQTPDKDEVVLAAISGRPVGLTGDREETAL